jgi:tetratricopeptide (TPR) repeat protein
MSRSKKTLIAFGMLSILAGCTPTPPPKDPVLTADPPVGGAEGLAAGTATTELDRAVAYIKNSKFDEAKKHLEAALAEKPDHAEANFYMGVTSEMLGDAKAAEGFYKKALAADPGLVDASANLAALYLLDPPRPDDAIPLLTKALEKAPDDANLNQNLAIAYGFKKDYANAAKAYDKVLAKGENAQVRYQYGALMFEANDMAKAADQLKKATLGIKEGPELVKIARMLGRAGAFPDCVKAFDAAIKTKNDPDWLVRRGMCKHEANDEAGARADYEAATKQDPSFVAGYYYLGMSYSLEKKSRANAIAMLEKAAKLGEGTELGKKAKDKLNEVKKQKP